MIDYRYHTNENARSFHKQRDAFVIIKDRLMFLPKNSSMSHFEFCKNMGLTKEEFNKITRGYYLQGKIVFYKDNFTYDNLVINTSKKYLHQIAKTLNIDNFDIYYGCNPTNNFALKYHYGTYTDGKIIER